MSLQVAVWLVIIAAGLVAILKTSIDIATTPTHRITALRWLTIVWGFVPLAPFFAALAVDSLPWSTALVVLSLMLVCINYIASAPAPGGSYVPVRVETVYLVLFASLCFIVIQMSIVDFYVNRLMDVDASIVDALKRVAE